MELLQESKKSKGKMQFHFFFLHYLSPTPFPEVLHSSFYFEGSSFQSMVCGHLGSPCHTYRGSIDPKYFHNNDILLA